MKKILFATTALVASAGVASAQDLGVALTGSAEMGIYSQDSIDFETGDVTDGNSQFFTDLDIRFTMSGVADNGLTFGATIDLDEAADRSNPGRFESPNVQGGEAIFVSFAGATLTMGDTDGAYDARIGEVALAGGSLADDETTHLGFDDQDGFGDLLATGLDGRGDGQVARFDYTFSAFTASISMEQSDNGADNSDDIYGVGFSYDTEMAGMNLGLGIGYQEQNDFANSFGVSVIGSMSNGFSAGISFGRTIFDDNGQRTVTASADATDAALLTVGATQVLVPGTDAVEYQASIGDSTQKNFGIGFGYEMNQLSMGINYGKVTNVFGNDGVDAHGTGIAVAYDLGGGLSARLGLSRSEFDDSDPIDTYSAGLQMAF